MKGLILIALLASSFSLPTQVPKTLFGDNYTGFKAFIAGFMSGFEGSDVELSSYCLDSA
jgi:hypothetical protein